MNEPKLASARVDAERLVRELISAFNSLKAIPALLTCSSPTEEKRQQRSPQSQEGRSKALNVVGGVLSTMSADPRPRPRTPFEALTEAVSDIDEAEPERISAFESAENSATRDYQMKAQSSPHEIIEEFRSDHEVIERLRVTPQELQSLSSSSLLGSLTCKQDVLFMLRLLREGPKSAKLQATVPPEPLDVPDENIERSMPDPSEMAERIRCESLAKLTESDSLRGIDRRSALRQFGVLSSALVFMTVMTWSCIKMMLNWRDHQSAKLALPASLSLKILVIGEILVVAGVAVGIYFRRHPSLTAMLRNLNGIWCWPYRSRSRTS